MIAVLKPYPAMKDSGVAWLGEVPEHWEVRRLRNLVEMRVSNVDKHTKDNEHPVRLCNYVDVYKNDRIRAQMTFMRATATREEVERFKLQRGDVLITKDSETWNDIGVPALVEEPGDDLICGYHLALLRPLQGLLSGDYLLRALQSTAVSYQFHVEANGVTRYGLSHAAIKSICLPLAPLPEQSAIVRFLNHADRRIGRYIRAKQKLIKLLDEQKQAIVHRAVTRSLDPNVRLKPSGVEWLDGVPEHWKELPLKRISRLDNSGSYGLEPEHGEQVMPVVTTAQIDRDGRFAVDRMPRRGFSSQDLQRYACRPGDILVVKSSGSIFNVISGKAGIVRTDTPPFVFSNFLMRIVPERAAVEPEYLFLLLSGYLTRERVKRMVAGTTYPNLRVGEYVSASLPLPPLHEQQAIVSVVSQATAAVDRAAETAQHEINLLREYRTRLIADVVTGKVDVREAAARLPDETEEPELLDEADDLTDAEEDTTDDPDAVPAEAEA